MLKKNVILLPFIPVMERANIEKVCQMKLLCFIKSQSSQDFIFSGLFIVTKSWYHTPNDRNCFVL